MTNNQNKKYVSPIKKKEGGLNLPTILVGEGVEIHHDRKNQRLLIDIDVGTRRGYTSKGKSIKIATATHMIEGAKKLSLNVFDKDMVDDELDGLEKFLDNKEKRALLDKRARNLE